MAMATVRARPGRAAGLRVPQPFPQKTGFGAARLHGRAGRLTAKHGGFRPPSPGRAWTSCRATASRSTWRSTRTPSTSRSCRSSTGSGAGRCGARRAGPEVGPTSAAYRCGRTGTREETCIFCWPNLTPFLPQAKSAYVASERVVCVTRHPALQVVNASPASRSR